MKYLIETQDGDQRRVEAEDIREALTKACELFGCTYSHIKHLHQFEP